MIKDEDSRRLFSDNYERAYVKAVSYSHRKKLGQFFTPFEVARLMSEWLLAHNNKQLSVLDPAAGLGIFPRAISRAARRKITFTLYEIDPAMSEQLQQLMGQAQLNFQIKTVDYLSAGWSKKYDGIIANPPYYKHHFIENKEALHQKIVAKTGVGFSMQTNIYCWFIIKAMNQLEPNGRIAFIVPSEFLNANYGEQVKQYLLQSGIVLHLIAVDFNEAVFDDVLTTSVIILGVKTKIKSGRINFFHINKADKLRQPLDKLLSSEPRKTLLTSELDPKKKWRSYWSNDLEELFANTVTLAKYGRFSRGIATGANDYFTLSPSEVVEYKLPASTLSPCITKAAHVKATVFGESDLQSLIKQNKKIYLFDGTKDAGAATKQYLLKGRQNKVNQAYLTRHRDPWYALEKRQPAKIWASVFDRAGLKFIWNGTSALNLTCFHGFYPNSLGDKFMDIFFIYINTPLAKKLFELEKREYGGGLGKFEPNDLNKAKVVDFELLPKASHAYLRKLQQAWLTDKSQADGQQILLAADREFRKVLRQGSPASPDPKLPQLPET